MHCWLLRVCYLWRMRERLPAGDAELAKQIGRFTEWQADHRRIAAGKAADEDRTQPLDGIAASLVRWLAAGPIALRFIQI